MSTASSASPSSWRDVLPIHPAAELIPPMSPDELKTLGEDIDKNGLTSPIVLWRPDGARSRSWPQLLDGRSRLDAIEIATGAPAIKTREELNDSDKFVFAKSDPYAFVISANIHRRHLNAEQKRDLIAKLIKATPEKSDRQIAETVKADHKTVGSVRTEMEGRGEIPHVETHTDSKGRKQPAKRKRTTKPQAAPSEHKPSRPDDIGQASAGEIERKDAEIEETQRKAAA
jgi:hypothetical protein